MQMNEAVLAGMRRYAAPDLSAIPKSGTSMSNGVGT
jgi:hypothetical protein